MKKTLIIVNQHTQPIKDYHSDKEKVKMDEIWIRKDSDYYEPLKSIVSDVINLYTEEVKKSKRNFVVQKQQTLE